jgi:aerobic carbon-monoxide dehydrogenase small subunit
VSTEIEVECTLNGRKKKLKGYPMARLLDVLREQGKSQETRLCGTKEGCGEGECGACTVQMDGEIVMSCLVPLAQCQGAHVVTIEGVANDTRAQRLQDAFIACGGAQCGICTPGMILASLKVLDAHPQPSVEEVRKGLAGNLCRCTGYMKIIDAVIASSDAES